MATNAASIPGPRLPRVDGLPPGVVSTSVRGRRPRVSGMPREVWQRLLSAWQEKPTVTHLVQTCKVGERQAKRAVYIGYPEIGAPPLSEVRPDPILVHAKMAEQRDEAMVHRAENEAARRSAEEATAARATLGGAAKTAQAVLHLATRVVELIEQGKLEISEDQVTPKLLLDLCTAIDRSSVAVERAMRIERIHAGEPEAVLGMRIGLLLDQCSTEELNGIRREGRLPLRLLGLAEERPAERPVIIEAESHPVDPEPIAPVVKKPPMVMSLEDVVSERVYEDTDTEALLKDGHE